MEERLRHSRRLGLCGAALTKARIPRFDIQAMTAVRDKLETLMDKCGFLTGAPFEGVTISLRYGLTNEQEPHYETINKKYADLPLAIELDTNELVSSDQDEMQKAFEIASLKALVHAGRKFKLSYAELEAELKAIESH